MLCARSRLTQCRFRDSHAMTGCKPRTDAVLIQTDHKQLRQEHVRPERWRSFCPWLAWPCPEAVCNRPAGKTRRTWKAKTVTARRYCQLPSDKFALISCRLNYIVIGGEKLYSRNSGIIAVISYYVDNACLRNGLKNKKVIPVKGFTGHSC